MSDSTTEFDHVESKGMTYEEARKYETGYEGADYNDLVTRPMDYAEDYGDALLRNIERFRRDVYSAIPGGEPSREGQAIHIINNIAPHVQRYDDFLTDPLAVLNECVESLGKPPSTNVNEDVLNAYQEQISGYESQITADDSGEYVEGQTEIVNTSEDVGFRDKLDGQTAARVANFINDDPNIAVDDIVHVVGERFEKDVLKADEKDADQEKLDEITTRYQNLMDYALDVHAGLEK